MVGRPVHLFSPFCQPCPLVPNRWAGRQVGPCQTCCPADVRPIFARYPADIRQMSGIGTRRYSARNRPHTDGAPAGRPGNAALHSRHAMADDPKTSGDGCGARTPKTRPEKDRAGAAGRSVAPPCALRGGRGKAEASTGCGSRQQPVSQYPEGNCAKKPRRTRQWLKTHVAADGAPPMTIGFARLPYRVNPTRDWAGRKPPRQPVPAPGCFHPPGSGAKPTRNITPFHIVTETPQKTLIHTAFPVDNGWTDG